nr:Toll/interleukin-1 receptor (TIR) domain-containing protein [Tanacetum cinerariifolium]
MAKCAAIGYVFLPFSFSSLGELEAYAVTLLKRIWKFSMAQDIKGRAAVHIFNRISFVIAKGMGAQIDVLIIFFTEVLDVNPGVASASLGLVAGFVTVVTMGVVLAIALILLRVIPGVESYGWLETVFIEEIVTNVYHQFGVLLRSTLPQDPQLIGVDDSIHFLSSWLQLGMGGIGKTSLANHVYKLHCHEFNRSSFVGNISRRCVEQSNGLLDVQKQLCDDISKASSIPVHDVSVYYYNKITEQSKWRIPDDVKVFNTTKRKKNVVQYVCIITVKYESTKERDNEFLVRTEKNVVQKCTIPTTRKKATMKRSYFAYRRANSRENDVTTVHVIMLWFFTFGLFVIFLCLYKMGVLHKSGTIPLDDPTQIQNTGMPSSSSSSLSFKYDVFLSFRGEDTRKTFVDHLYSALEQRLIRTYKDDITLPRGESVGPALIKAIQESRHAVIIFSKNYADSSWCLDELVHIMKCRADNGQIVMPVFYDVDPSDVRKQKGDFGKAFSKQVAENTTKAELWRKELVAASNISGWEPKNIDNGYESMVIRKIVDTIFRGLFPLNSDIDEGLVGMRARMQDLISQLKIGSGGVRMVGIWGLGGGGKTNLANSVYMEIIRHFKSHFIIENIREESRKYGLKKLQGDILSDLYNREIKVNSVAVGKRKMKSMLCGSNHMLLILDDVDHRDQLEALAGSRDWFGDGSRIIITTRDEHLLKTHKVDHVSHVRLLSHDEAIELFNSHAYNEEKNIKNYEKLSLQVVSYADGLPLALIVLGSFLYDKDAKEWTSTMDRPRDIPESQIVDKLKISYDGLKPVEKELFLDIACFFRGELESDTMELFDACGFHPEIGIKVLIQKSLITINSEERFGMHDLIQEMGHYIVRREHPNNPEKHSRVWKHAEVSNMYFGDATVENDQTEAIEIGHDIHWPQFIMYISKMKKLRWLRLI